MRYSFLFLLGVAIALYPGLATAEGPKNVECFTKIVNGECVGSSSGSSRSGGTRYFNSSQETLDNQRCQMNCNSWGESALWQCNRGSPQQRHQCANSVQERINSCLSNC